MEVDYQGVIGVKGYISRPQMTRANRSYQHFYLNGRMIRSRLIEKILEECYKDLIMPGSFPMAILQIPGGSRAGRCKCPSDQDGGAFL